MSKGRILLQAPAGEGAPGKSLYRQIYESLRTRILEGEWKGNERLPSKRSLADRLGVSVNTVTAAYQQLLDEGFITAVERSGYYVLPLPLEQLLPASAASVAARSPAARAEASCCIDFTSPDVDGSVFPYRTFQKIYRELWSSRDPELLRYPPVRGHLVLRREIAVYLAKNRGLSVSPDHLVIQANSSALLRILLKLLPEDSRFALEDPGFRDFYDELCEAGRPFSLLPVGPEGLDLKSLRSSRAKVVSVTPTHQFPTGSVMPITRRSELLAYAAEKPGRWLLEDDYDSEFRYEGLTIPSLKSLDRNDRVIYLGNFSKSVSPGLRISYMVLPEELSVRFDRDESMPPCPVGSSAQLALAKFLEGGHYNRHLARMRKHYRAKRELMLSTLARYAPDSDILGSEAGFHLNVRLRHPLPEEELEKRFHRAGVLCKFMSDYHIKKEPRGVHKARRGSSEKILILNFAALSHEQIEEGLRRIFATLHEV